MNRPMFTIQKRRLQIMKVALAEGIFTDHQCDGICEQLLGEGWLERAKPVAPRRHVSRAPTYLPTEQAEIEWDDQVAI